jgi:hypothetical protein
VKPEEEAVLRDRLHMSEIFKRASASAARRKSTGMLQYNPLYDWQRHRR